MSKEYKIRNGLVINDSTVITGITNDSGLTNLSTVLPTSNAVKGYVDSKISIESSILNSQINSVAVIISSETSQRISADSSLYSIISTEISQRTSVDSSIVSSLSSEISTRTNADSSLNTSISIETSQRISVDSSLSTVLNNKLNISGGTLTGNLTGITLGLTSQLYLSGITNDATQNDVLYYNTTTKEITYGTKPSGGTPGGLNTYIQYNSGNTFSDSSNLTWNNSSLNVSGNYNTLSSNIVLRSSSIGVSNQVNNIRETYSSGNIKIEMYDTIWKNLFYIQNDYGSNGNIFAGYYSGHALANGLLNTGYGTYSLLNVSGGSSNTAIGTNALNFLTSGSYCTAIGAQSGEQGNTSNGIYVGAYAGKYETVSNKLFIDSLDRVDESTARTSSIIYGVISGVSSNQELYFNATSYTKRLVKTYQLLTSSASITMNVRNGQNARVVLGVSATLTLSNLADGDEGNIVIIQDAVGNRTLTVSPTPRVINGGAGVIKLSTTANSVDMLSYTYDGTYLYITYGKNYS